MNKVYDYAMPLALGEEGVDREVPVIDVETEV